MKITTCITAILLSFMLVACGGNKKKTKQPDNNAGESASLSDAVNAFKGLSDMAKSAGDMESLQKKLAKLTPLSNDELKAALPKSLMGIKRTKYTVSQQMYINISTAEADYKKDRDHNIHLSIWDGAGKAGSSLVALRIWELRRDFEKQTQDGFDKSIKLNGRQAEAQQKKYDDGRLTSQIDFAVNNRFLITLKGRGFSEKDLEKAYKDLDFSSLE